jgi:nucleotide-binding universal stress UspA family protein
VTPLDTAGSEGRADHRAPTSRAFTDSYEATIQGRATVFNKIIVGVDEQPAGRDAIALAHDLMTAGGGLTLAHVHRAETMPVHASNPGFQAAERERSLALLAEVRDAAGINAARICVGSASVGRGLHELAEQENADLLVVGSNRRGLLGRVLIADDTQHALDGAPCAVAVAPAAYAQRSPVLTEIGVGYDASPESEHALATARAFASERGVRLSAFEAISLPAYAFNRDVGPIDTSILALVEQARQRIASLGDIEPHAAYGAAAEELTVYSASLDVLFIGSRGYGALGRVMHGSTALALARTARCPLIVLTREGAAIRDAGSAHAAALAHG